ncbi:short-chain dehydrogenase [Coprinopsis sp. MPI-PUGE-AT-0042]|nr:short-chain dehydrogenase [Coprinopsis sp. MPI-PUGE-AT-0042]
MKLGALQFIRNQRKAIPPPQLVNLAGKTILITGANTGIGFEAAKHFARMKPGKLIIACRSKEKGEAAVSLLQKETGFSNVHLRLVDLARFSSVTEFANKFEDEEERLDIFVANAALGRTDYVLSEDGWESSVQVNNLSTLLLNIRMLPLMIKTGQRFSVEPRLVVVGSGLHYWAKFDKRIAESSEPLKTFSSKEYSTPSVMEARYADSKVLALFMTRQLAKALEKTPVVANVVDPGFCISDFRKELERQFSKKILMDTMEKLLGRSAEAGAAQYVWAALAENTNGRMRGAYVDTLAVQEPSDYSLSKEGLELQNKFWGDMTKVLGEADPKVPIILNDLSSSTV